LGLSASGLSDPVLQQIIEDLQGQVRSLEGGVASASASVERFNDLDSLRTETHSELGRLRSALSTLQLGLSAEGRHREEIERVVTFLHAYVISNATGGAVPAYGIASLDTYTEATRLGTIRVPVAGDTGMLLCFGPMGVANNSNGLGYRRDIQTVRVASAEHGSLTVGSIIGRTAGSFEASASGQADFKVVASLASPNVLAEMLHTSPITNLDVILNGLGQEIPAGLHGWLIFDSPCIIKAWKAVGDQPGSISIALWKSTFADAPPTALGTMTGASGPSIVAGIKNEGTDLRAWVVSIAAGDVIAVNVLSCTYMTLVTLSLKLQEL